MLTQINLQTNFGGGEVYTAFLCRALDILGIPTKILIHPNALFWKELKLPKNTTLVRIDPKLLVNSISIEDKWILGHGALPHSVLKIKNNCLKTAIAHLPIQERDPDSYRNHDMVFPVSAWVQQGLKGNNIPTWNKPLYGVADLSERKKNSIIRKSSRYDWDKRKVRDLLFSKIEPLIQPLLSKPEFVKKSGITIGVVSRITPIKQFPLLFSLLSTILSKYPQFNIEIFGSGGYASVRDLRKAIYPIQDRVRFWGYQSDVSSVYSNIDYLMTGLPEREALGLNIIEAQFCGVPVLAPDNLPFTETILDGKTGYLYTDPRKDNGESFEKLLNKILFMTKKINPNSQSHHLDKFSMSSFTNRIEDIAKWVEKEGYL